MMSGGIHPKKQSIENTKTILKSQTYKNLVRNNDFSTNIGLDSRKYLSTCLSQSLFRTALKWIVEANLSFIDVFFSSVDTSWH